jgi:DNA-binding FrmR family transcriptional regulator
MATNTKIPKEVIMNRLKRIEGQVRGIQKMLADDRECESLVTQLAAIRSAVESVGQLILTNYMDICFRKNVDTEESAVESLARVVAIWGRVRVGDSSK